MDLLRLAAIFVVFRGKYKHLICFEILCIAVTWIMINTTAMLDSVLSPANFARDYVPIQTIFMACKAMPFISAGSSMDHPSYITWYLNDNIGRSTHVPSSAPPMAYAKLKLRHNQLKQRLQEDTRPSSTRRWRTIFVDIVFYANTLYLSIVFARFDCELLTFYIDTHPLNSCQTTKMFQGNTTRNGSS